MTSDVPRRVAMRGLALGALVPLSMAAWPLSTAQAARRGAIIPAGSFALTRVLSRGLIDGATIVVTRRWRIAFAAAGVGLTVRGSQIFADVAAPAMLAELAAIERGRSTAGLFPLALDAEGLIRDDERGGDDAALSRALDAGAVLVAELRLEAASHEDARAFMARLGGMSAGAVSRLPRDLFFPVPDRNVTVRKVALADGETGSVTVETAATVVAATGLMTSSERRITTHAGAGERITSERWMLVPDSPTNA